MGSSRHRSGLSQALCEALPGAAMSLQNCWCARLFQALLGALPGIVRGSPRCCTELPKVWCEALVGVIRGFSRLHRALSDTALGSPRHCGEFKVLYQALQVLHVDLAGNVQRLSRCYAVFFQACLVAFPDFCRARPGTATNSCNYFCGALAGDA